MATISGLDVKRELVDVRVKDDEAAALLSGFVRACMSLSLGSKDGLMLGLDCQVDFVRDYIVGLMLKHYKISPKYTEPTLMYADCEKLLRLLGILEADTDEYIMAGVPERFSAFPSAYVRGMFLGCGSFSARETDGGGDVTGGGGYHLEFSFMNEDLADGFSTLLVRSDIYMHKMVRAEKFVIYAKDSETVGNCLALMHADKLVLKLANTVVRLSVKKDVNRRNNCDLANMTRTAVAAVEVVDAIEYIENTVGLDSLDPKLVEAADARINSPDLSLGELAYELGISKSGLKHRYDRIIKAADKLRYDHGEKQ